MRNTLIVAWKEFRTFFQTPIGWVILFFFTLLGGLLFFAAGRFFLQREASMRGLFEWLPILFLFYAPAITMRLWAEERRAGTVETLLTLPLKDWEIVVGKYLAALGLIAVWLLCLSPLAMVVCWFGDPDLGPILGGFIGALFLGGAYAAIGVAASAFTENQIIAFVVSLVGSFVCYAIGFDLFVALFPEAIGSFLFKLSLDTHFRSISRGVLDSRDLLYYLSFIAFFLVINVWAVRREKGKGLTIALAAPIALLVNYLAVGHFFRIDLTDDDRYTLSADTKRVLDGLKDDLRITAYLSTDVPAQYSNTRRDIEDLVREFESNAKSRLRVEIVDPSKSEELKKAAEAAGVMEATINTADTDKLEIKKAYLGMVVEYAGKTEKLPFVPNIDMLEYDLVSRIARMSRTRSVKVAWQLNDPFGGMQIPNMPRPPQQDRHSPQADLQGIDQAIKTEYETTTVDLKSKVPDDVGVVFLCNAGGGLSDVQKFHLDQYLMRGGNLIVMAEGSEPMNFGGMGGGGGSPTMRSGAQKLPDDLFEHCGFKIEKNSVIDLQCMTIRRPNADSPFTAFSPYPGFPLVVADSIDQDHPLSSRMSDLLFLFPSQVTFLGKPLTRHAELIKSSKHAKKIDGFIDLSFEKIVDTIKTEADAESFNGQFTLAGLLELDANFPSFFTARSLPSELTDGGAGGDDHAGHDHGAGSPLDGLLDPGDGHDDDDHDSSGGGSDGSSSSDSSEKPRGGPRLGATQEAPAPQEPAPVPPSAGDAQPPAPEAQAPAIAPPAPAAKEIDWIKNSTAPAKIVVIGTSDFVRNDLVGRDFRNDLFVLSSVDYLLSEGLSGLRARRVASASFQVPSDFAKSMAWALGWFATPLLLAALGFFTYVWRRTIRPAAARRRMAAMGRS